MIGLDSPSHTVYARVDPACLNTLTPEECASRDINVGKVIDVMVTEGHRQTAKSILERGVHVDTADHYPSSTELLQLGAVWLLNETSYAKGDTAHAKRLSPKDAEMVPNWSDMTLRVHYVPDRFFVAFEYDWKKYCKGLLLDGAVAEVEGKRAVVPVVGLPDEKDGVIVFEVSWGWFLLLLLI